MEEVRQFANYCRTKASELGVGCSSREKESIYYCSVFRSSLDRLVSLALGAARVRSCGSAKLEEKLELR